MPVIHKLVASPGSLARARTACTARVMVLSPAACAVGFSPEAGAEGFLKALRRAAETGATE